MPSVSRDAVQASHCVNFNRPRAGVGFQFAFGYELIAPMLRVIAIKLGLFRNAKLQLVIRECRAKLELGVPSTTNFKLNAP